MIVLATRRAAVIRELHSLQRSQKRCAQLLGIQAPQVSVIAKRLGLTFSKTWCRAETPRAAARAAGMAALYREGYTLEEIGAQHGLTRERVRQLMTKHLGINHRDGGQHKRVEALKARRRAKRDGAYLKRYGCTFAEWQQLRDLGLALMASGVSKYRTPLYAYRSQENNAAHRGIEWRLNLWQWWQIWQGSGLWEQRGRGQGYVMCRTGDQGAYEAGNVYIGKATENSSEGRGKNNSLPIGVRETQSGRFVAHRVINGVKLRLGTHDTPELAYAAYLMAGERTRIAA
jgi:hypothetical protein